MAGAANSVPSGRPGPRHLSCGLVTLRQSVADCEQCRESFALFTWLVVFLSYKISHQPTNSTFLLQQIISINYWPQPAEQNKLIEDPSFDVSDAIAIGQQPSAVFFFFGRTLVSSVTWTPTCMRVRPQFRLGCGPGHVSLY